MTAPKSKRGGPRPGSGRPREAGAKRSSITLDCTPEQRDVWREAAAVAGVSLRGQMRELTDAWAERVLTSPARDE